MATCSGHSVQFHLLNWESKRVNPRTHAVFVVYKSASGAVSTTVVRGPNCADTVHARRHQEAILRGWQHVLQQLVAVEGCVRLSFAVHGARCKLVVSAGWPRVPVDVHTKAGIEHADVDIGTVPVDVLLWGAWAPGSWHGFGQRIALTFDIF